MRILGIETSGAEAGIALLDGSEIVAAGHVAVRGRTGEKLLDLIHGLLGLADWKLSDTQRLAVDAGPGSFTGLRVGLSLAKGLSMGAGVPVVTVSSLEALALESPSEGLCLTALRAPRGMVYGAVFDTSDGAPVPLVGDSCTTVPALWEKVRGVESATSSRQMSLVGPAAAEMREGMSGGPAGWTFAIHPGCKPTAAGVARLAAGAKSVLSAQELAGAEPRYLRGADVRKPKAATPTQAAP